MIEKNVGILMPLVAGKSCREQGFFQLADFRYVNGLAIQLRSLPCWRRKVHCEWDRRQRPRPAFANRRSAVLERQGDAEDWIAMSKVRGPIQRIDIPAIFIAAIVQTLLFPKTS